MVRSVSSRARLRRFEPLDLDLARETYLDAYQAAQIAGHLAGNGDLKEVSRAARSLPPPPHPPRPADLLLDGLTLLVTDGPTIAAPVLRQATSAFADRSSGLAASGPSACSTDTGTRCGASAWLQARTSTASSEVSTSKRPPPLAGRGSSTSTTQPPVL